MLHEFEPQEGFAAPEGQREFFQAARGGLPEEPAQRCGAGVRGHLARRLTSGKAVLAAEVARLRDDEIEMANGAEIRTGMHGRPSFARSTRRVNPGLLDPITSS